MASHRTRVSPRAHRSRLNIHARTIKKGTPKTMLEPSVGGASRRETLTRCKAPITSSEAQSFRSSLERMQKPTPGVYGRGLSDYLVTQIQGRGVDVERVIPEDFGYCIMVRRKPLRLWIACGNRAGCTDEWIAFAVAEGGLLGRVIGNIHPAQEIDRISEMLGEIMKAAPGAEAYSLEADRAESSLGSTTTIDQSARSLNFLGRPGAKFQFFHGNTEYRPPDSRYHCIYDPAIHKRYEPN